MKILLLLLCWPIFLCGQRTTVIAKVDGYADSNIGLRWIDYTRFPAKQLDLCGGSFSFDLKKPAVMEVYTKQYYGTWQVYLEPGDSLFFEYNGRVKFKGKHAPQNNMLAKLDTLHNQQARELRKAREQGINFKPEELATNNDLYFKKALEAINESRDTTFINLLVVNNTVKYIRNTLLIPHQVLGSPGFHIWPDERLYPNIYWQLDSVYGFRKEWLNNSDYVKLLSYSWLKYKVHSDIIWQADLVKQADTLYQGLEKHYGENINIIAPHFLNAYFESPGDVRNYKPLLDHYLTNYCRDTGISNALLANYNQ